MIPEVQSSPVSAQQGSASARSALTVAVRWVMIAACVGYAARLLWMVHAYAVDIMFRDQWSFYPPVWAQPSWWRAFAYQHGPHRQGLGNVLSKALLPLTHANIQAEALIICLLAIGASVLALGLRRRVAGKARWYDGFLVLLMLTPGQYALFARVPNPSHGVLPLVLVLITCMALLLSRGIVRVLVLGVLVFVSVYTGFGVFLGLAVPGVLGLLLLRGWVRGEYRSAFYDLLTLGTCCLAAATFFIGYHADPSAPKFVFPDPNWPQYPNMMAYQFGRLAGLADPVPMTCVAGWAVMVVCVGVLLWHAAKFLRREDPPAVSVAITLLLGFTLVYALNTAIGRISFGPWMMVSSRYLPLLFPAAVAVYLHCVTISRPALRRGAVVLFAAVAVAASAFMRAADVKDMVSLGEGKRRWVAAYLQTGSAEEAQRLSKFELYPDLRQARADERLREMRRLGLGPFRTAGVVAGPATGPVEAAASRPTMGPK